MTQTGGSGGPEPAAGGAPDSSVVVSTGPESEQAAAPEAADLVATASPDLIADSLGEYARIWWRRVRGGESGALPVVIGLIVIVVYFQVRNSLFLSAGNLVNLITQAAFIVTFGMAEVFVLLLGEIDLSVGYNAALGAVITLWMLSSNLPLWLAVVAGLAFSAAFAGLEGVIITRLRLPSFVVTLAGYLGGFGLLLALIDMAAPGSGGTIRLNSSIIADIEGGTMSPAAGWIITAVAVVLAAAYMLVRDARLPADVCHASDSEPEVCATPQHGGDGDADIVVGAEEITGADAQLFRGLPSEHGGILRHHVSLSSRRRTSRR